MIITNFKIIGYHRDSAFATIDVTEGILWWKKTTTRDVTALCTTDQTVVGYWKFVNTGTWTPNRTVEKLYHSYINSKKLQNLKDNFE